MASPILLDTTPMLLHGLGSNGGQVPAPGGGWSGTFGVGFVNLWAFSVTVASPDGSYVFGRANFSVFTSVAGSIIEGCTQDSITLALTGWGKFYFNQTYRLNYGYNFYVGRLAAGAHTINIGTYVEAGQITFDSNGGGTTLLWEIPA